MADYEVGLTFLINAHNNRLSANLLAYSIVCIPPIRALNMHLQELKAKSPADLLAYAEDLAMKMLAPCVSKI